MVAAMVWLLPALSRASSISIRVASFIVGSGSAKVKGSVPEDTVLLFISSCRILVIWFRKVESERTLDSF